MASLSFSGAGKSRSRRAGLGMRKPTRRSRRLSKNFADRIRWAVRQLGHLEPDKPLKVLAFDEARFGLINWHKRRYCPKGFRPPYTVRRAYKWTYLYAAVDPTRSGESLCAYLPGVDGGCLETFLEHLGQAYTLTITLWSYSTALQAIAPRRLPILKT